MKRHLLLILFGVIIIAVSCSDGNDSSALQQKGKGGSMARFAITNTHVYTVDANNLHVYNIEENGGLEKVNQLALDPGVETIYALNNKLYLGTASSMITYDITNEEDPKFDSRYTHFTACDPVVVEDTIAYVTIRSNGCRQGNQNILEILDVKDPANPKSLSVTELTGPYGLGIDGNTLFVCEGENGFMVFDVSDPRNPVKKGQVQDGHTYDLIPDQGLLIVTGDDGVRQYSYSDFKVELLSKIEVEK